MRRKIPFNWPIGCSFARNPMVTRVFPFLRMAPAQTHNRPIVIKYGGSLLEEPGHRSLFLKDVAELFKKKKIVLVHGGGKEISREMEKAGLEAKFVKGRRV